MKDALKIALGIVIGVLGLAACAFCAFLLLAGGSAALLGAIPTATPVSPAGDIPYRPPASAPSAEPPRPPGASIRYDDLTVILAAYEFSDAYRTEYDFQETPPEGARFLWLLVSVENVGSNATYTPSASEFAVIYRDEQTDSDLLFSERPGYQPFESGQLFPGVSRTGWIRFTIPSAAQPPDLTVAFKPFDLFSETYYTWSLAP